MRKFWSTKYSRDGCTFSINFEDGKYSGSITKVKQCECNQHSSQCYFIVVLLLFCNWCKLDVISLFYFSLKCHVLT